MTLAAVQKEVERWSPEDQDQLASYLAVLRLKRSKQHGDELDRRLNDGSDEGWLNIGEVRDRIRSQEPNGG